MPEISVIIPVYNERESLDPLLAELFPVLVGTGRSFEIVMVDDGSDDGSGEGMLRASKAEPRVVPVRLEGHAGQSAALAAGLARSGGEIIVTLDADLQNDPEDIPRLLAALEGAEVVSGIRRPRRDSAGRRLSSWVANAVRRAVLGDPVHDIGCSLKAYRRAALEGIPVFDGFHRFLPALCLFRGARLIEIPVSHRRRRFGRSKYGPLDRMGRGLFDLVGVRWLKMRLLRHRVREVKR
jgi:glycosyltransferase involved in cell wall biosynthesis